MNQQLCIHIAFCVNDAYVPYITVAIKSIIENNRASCICFHILSDFITEKNRARIDSVLYGCKNVSAKIYCIDDRPLSKLTIRGWTIYAWYRILLPDILPEDVKRVLYLDADTLVVTDISSLFSMDMTGKTIASVVEDRTFETYHYDRLKYDTDKHYICSGVLLINLEYWRRYNLTEQMIDWALVHGRDLTFPDQDTINYICQDSKILLPLRFGIVEWFFTNDRFYVPPYLEQLKECIYNPAIIHYAFCVPWYKDAIRHLMYDEWIKYNKMLTYPVKPRYKATGVLRLKHSLWNMFHPFKDRRILTIRDVERKIAEGNPDILK